MMWASLTDLHTKTPMGVTAENLAVKYELTREEVIFTNLQIYVKEFFIFTKFSIIFKKNCFDFVFFFRLTHSQFDLNKLGEQLTKKEFLPMKSFLWKSKLEKVNQKKTMRQIMV